MEAIPPEIQQKIDDTIATIKLKHSKPTRYCKKARAEVQKFGCTFCSYGHMMNCHFPYDCGQAGCYENDIRVRFPETDEEGKIID